MTLTFSLFQQRISLITWLSINILNKSSEPRYANLDGEQDKRWVGDEGVRDGAKKKKNSWAWTTVW